MRNCVFCEPEVPERILIRGERFQVMEDRHPIVQGHHLLISLGHVASLIDVEAGWSQELEALKQEACTLLRAKYGELVLFEHGRMPVCTTEPDSECFHAHLHMLPFPGEVDWKLAGERFDLPSLAVVIALRSIVPPGHEYVFLEHRERRQLVIPSRPLPKRWFRTKLEQDLAPSACR